MAYKRSENIDLKTRKAWISNWEEHSIERVMEIFNYTRVKRLLDTLSSILPKRGKILEGGCGLGPWVIKLRSMGYDVEGVDYDPVSIGKIKLYDKTLPVHVANIEDMPFENETFDAYLSFGVLEHFIEGPQEAIKEAHRVLKPEGRFIVLVPYMNMLLRVKYPFLLLKKNAFLRKIFGKGEKDFYYEKYFKVNEIRGLIEQEGFSVESVFPADHIFSFVSFSGIFRDKSTYDGENELAIKLSDILKKIFPWQTAGSCVLVVKKK